MASRPRARGGKAGRGKRKQRDEDPTDESAGDPQRPQREVGVIRGPGDLQPSSPAGAQPDAQPGAQPGAQAGAALQKSFLNSLISLAPPGAPPNQAPPQERAQAQVPDPHLPPPPAKPAGGSDPSCHAV